MALPQAIERQAAEAEQLQASIYGSQAESTEVDQPVPVVVTPASPKNTASVVEMPVVAEPVQVEPKEDVAYWKKRFETVQGKLNAEMPQLHQQLREQGEQLKDLSNQLSEKATPAEAAPSLVTQKDLDDYGEDLIDTVRRTSTEMAKQVFAAERAALEKRFGAVESQMGQVGRQVERTAVETFWGDVTKLTPDWATVDKNPTWIDWLDSSPDYADVTYRSLAGQAIQRGDPQKIAKLVETWKRETGQTQSAGTSRRPQPNLSGQQAPSTVRSGGSTPVTALTYSRAEYEALYDVRNPRRYGDKKAEEMIAEADLAVAENRVRWT